ncbi:beta-ketoacyl-ACP reductase [Rhodothalassium salexigens]|uniref:acetoacetyl-CoA reductase n=1 Tax=Rhodothalassium salexigens TaxID=1086 RepID=UPI001912A501|nr:acetoacetyl-CoA reductase [Rhodothalassium salexigens]MBK5911115.1 beta-ketoacyl-ACP reductase [Rhodothalassium salexigens]MBK5919467.1 beta-ketoacyl-ACP reductase [Rhodothalassium salexigens]
MTRIALITGGIKGLGAATADALARQGCTVVVTARTQEIARRFEEQTGRPCFGWDVADYDACRDGVERVEKAVGPIDILVNNAGVVADAMLHKMTHEQWVRVIRTDLDALFNMCQPVLAGMRQRRFGRIVNISSVNGQKGQAGQTNYAAAKAGVIGFTKALALEGARKGVTVNAVAPGYADTDMVAGVPDHVMAGILATVPVGRLAEPHEIARCVAFLASDEAGFITGATLSANGGLHMA